MGIAILKGARVIVVLRGAIPADMAEHIRNGFPQYIPDLPTLTVEEYADDALPPIDPPSPEDIAAIEAEKLQNAFIRTLLIDRFELENRICVLEGKAPITEAQYRTAVKAKLGI